MRVMKTDPQPTPAAVEHVDADHTMIKRLGDWTSARMFHVRARSGAVVLDLRSPHVAKRDVDIHVDLDRGMLKLLVPEGAVIEHFGRLDWDGRGRVKDIHQDEITPDGRRIRISGRVRGGEIRIHRNGMAVLSAMFSRAFIEDARRARREGRYPTIDDPTRDPKPLNQPGERSWTTH